VTGGVSLAEICVVACAEVWRGDGEVLASPIGIVPTIGGIGHQVGAPQLALTVLAFVVMSLRGKRFSVAADAGGTL